MSKSARRLPLSYIVRIYRREPPEQIAGTVEIPEYDERAAFNSFEDLESILLGEPPSDPPA